MHKLAIVGTHPDTRSLAPFDDPEYDIWVFNEAPQATPETFPNDPAKGWCKRWTACFQMHRPAVYMSRNNFVNAAHWDWLQQEHRGKVIWMQNYDDLVPNSRRYPMEEIKASLPAAAFSWFESTASMALALGLYLGYERIEIWGVDLSSNTEYAYQQKNWLYWCGAAKATLGERFILHSGLQHFQARVYGYEGETQIEREFYRQRAEFWQAEEAGRKSIFDNLKRKLDQAIIDNDKRAADLLVQIQDAALAVGEASGCLQEAQNYAARSDPIPRQQFERRGATAQGEFGERRSLMDKEAGKAEYVWNAWRQTGQIQARDQLRVFASNMVNYAYQAGGSLGVWNESAMYMTEYDNRVTAAGGQRTLTALGVAQ